MLAFWLTKDVVRFCHTAQAALLPQECESRAPCDAFVHHQSTCCDTYLSGC